MEAWKRTVYICLFGAFLTSCGLSQVAPILPLYLIKLGVRSDAELAVWSGLSMGITYLIVALAAPFWGRLADQKGRKLILLRASFGMMITNALCGMVTSPEQLVACRMLQGLVSGFYSGSVTLVASETPSEHTGWALGLLASANLAGSLVGPLIGGYLAGIFGIRSTFFIVAFVLLISFILTWSFVHESYKPAKVKIKMKFSAIRSQLPYFNALVTLAISGFSYALAFMSLQPIITVYVKQLVPPDTPHIAFLAGAVFSATGLAQMLSSSFLGNLIDHTGPRKVLCAALLYVGLLTIPQAYVTSLTQLAVLRFLLGIGLGGLLPALNTYIATHCPQQLRGQVFSYNQSTQFLGYFLGAVGGSSLMAWLGFTALFWVTGFLFLINAAWIYLKLDRNTAPVDAS